MIDILKVIADAFLIMFPDIWAVIGQILFFGGVFVALVATILADENRVSSWFKILRFSSILASGIGIVIWGGLSNRLGIESVDNESFMQSIFLAVLCIVIQIGGYAFFEAIKEEAKEEAKADEDAAKQTEGETDNGSV